MLVLSLSCLEPTIRNSEYIHQVVEDLTLDNRAAPRAIVLSNKFLNFYFWSSKLFYVYSSIKVLKWITFFYLFSNLRHTENYCVGFSLFLIQITPKAVQQNQQPWYHFKCQQFSTPPHPISIFQANCIAVWKSFACEWKKYTIALQWKMKQQQQQDKQK